LQSRLDDASLRREKALSEISNRARSHCNQVSNAVNTLNTQKKEESSTLSRKLAEKAQFTEMQKENLKREYSIKVQEKMDKISQIKEADASKAAEIDMKVQQKLATANNRKKEVLTTVSSCTASSMKDRFERAKLNRLSQDAGLESLRKKLDDKMLTASQRKEDTMVSITSKVAEENQNIVERTKYLMNQREQSLREILCKHENKLEGASQRKQRLVQEELQKQEMSNLRREKVLESNNTKNEVLIPKAKEDLTLKLEEAAARRTTFLLQKSEQAGFKTNANKGIDGHSDISSSGTMRTKSLDMPTEQEGESSPKFKNFALCDVANVFPTGILDFPKIIIGLVAGFLMNIFLKD